ncbi:MULTISPECIES: glycosyltransferase family 2 protein [Halorussus]|uniref:glycosyltransferase family 2 protein n=1 Tax=Halorussus TaxID=1070314 RepID=UPI00209D0C46|nr:glycosyltransferase family 2 protein [Halorussus vallis]USZ76548.1 glycosyltransferase family 2 protein [Halorussus vallis]
MYSEKSVAVVVPAYNEKGLVGGVIDTIPSFVDRVYVVDDRSTDGTWAEIREHAERRNAEVGARSHAGVRSPAGERASADGHGSDDASGGERAGGGSTRPAASAQLDGGRYVVPIRREENGGVGAAIKTGYRRAAADGMDVVAVMAGDGQMDPDALDRLVAPVADGRVDYAKGNRLQSRRDRGSMSNFRYFGNTLLTGLTKVASGYWRISDPQNGYTAISREAIEAIDLDSAYDRYGFANDVLIRLNVAGMRVADVPTPSRYGNETSHIDLKSFVPRLSALLATGFLRRVTETYVRRGASPVAALFGVGVLASVVGTLGAVRNRLSGEDGSGLRTALAGLCSLGLAGLLDMNRSEPLQLELDDESPSQKRPRAPEADE